MWKLDFHVSKCIRSSLLRKQPYFNSINSCRCFYCNFLTLLCKNKLNYWFFEIEFRSNFSFILFYWNIRFTKRVRVLIRDTFYNIKSIEELSMKFMKKEHVQHLATIMLAPQKKGWGYIIKASWRTSKKWYSAYFFHTFVYIIKDWDVALLRFLYLQYSGNVLLQK